MTRDYDLPLEIVGALHRVDAAARALLYVQDRMPGDDLGQAARALVMIELRVATLALDELQGASFDAAAYLEELKKKDKR